ncbi:uncharacterized protein LOC579849 [Strongylocentrotus purpuratus]|uniref:F-box domain-containing protein n=1 Tax=Strongylocentrotus purpuratus TaxID=7668 RepID=A0A7M7N6B3_STRPU|nr:uncharacterized protein LOC579849 [Strongylocentrotus purpuratus]
MSESSYCTRRKRRKLNCGQPYVISRSRRRKARTEQANLKREEQCRISCNISNNKLETAFSRLPLECKVRIFSFLSDTEKCEIATVCSDWARVIRTPRLWQVADFTYALARSDLPKDKCEAIRCIKERATSYIYHFVSRGALLRCLFFELDIIEGEEIWLKFLIYLLKMTNSHELKVVHAEWTTSPEFMPFQAEEMTWKSDRVKSFLCLLTTLSEMCPAIEEIHTPFDWSFSSVKALSTFKQLHTLELDKYWVFAVLREENLNYLLESLPRLKRFKLSVSVPLIGMLSFPQYIMSSESLEVLDISNSTCFFLRSVHLPALTSIATARNRWTGPLLSRDALSVPCLYNI